MRASDEPGVFGAILMQTREIRSEQQKFTKRQKLDQQAWTTDAWTFFAKNLLIFVSIAHGS
jgi:hypothetical protein